MNGYVYILRSLKNGRFYIGSTNDVNRRFVEHKLGRCITTKKMLPVELAFFQEYDSLKIAKGIEYKLKKLKRKDIIERIIREGRIQMGP
jgi:putative endonuclease